MLTYVAVGIVAGLLAGLFGVGGGLVIVPVLAGLFIAQGFPSEYIMQMAVGSSLATIVVTSLSSVRAHHSRGGVRWPLVMQMSVAIVIGTWIGSYIAHLVPSEGMARFFGVFELAVAAHMLFGKPPAAHQQEPGKSRNLVAGTTIGGLSALLGIGGGTLTVPYLVWHNIPMREAVGTAAACGMPIAVSGAIGFMVAGWSVAGLPAGSTGYVFWPAVGGICLASVLAAPLGAKLAYRLPKDRLKQVFALMLVGLGLYMLFGAA